MRLTDKKLRIAMLGHKRIPSREGGIEIVVEELSTRMVQMGHSVTCYNRSGHHVSGKEFDRANGNKMKQYKGVRLKTVFTLDKKGIAAMTSSVSASFCAAFGRYDIVHYHAEGPCAMLWLPKLFGKRCICTIHGLDHKRQKWNRFAKAYIMLGEKAAVKFADEIIVLSGGVQKYFREVYGRSTVLIPNGVTRPELRAAELIDKRFGLKKDSYLLYLGRIVPEKGLRYLLKAFKNVKTDKKLVIAGGSSDTEAFLNELRSLAAGDKRVIFTGFVQGQMLEELYSNAYLYTLPSDLEGMPLSLLEAMSYGNCCLVSDIEECAKVVEDHAVTFKKGDTADLQHKLQELCDSEPLCIRYKEKAADFICRRYNWDQTARQTIHLYQKH